MERGPPADHTRFWWRLTERSRRSEEMGGGSGPTSSLVEYRASKSVPWSGSAIRIGEVLIAVVDLRGRCVMKTFDRILSRTIRRCCRTSSGLGGIRPACVGTITVLAARLTVYPAIRQYFSLRPEFGKQIASV
jgi:hypothetical protein